MTRRRVAVRIGSTLAAVAAAIGLVLAGTADAGEIAAVGIVPVLASIARAGETHDPIEYFRSWSGYSHPLHLSQKISQAQAQELAAAGYAYVIGTFDAGGRLTRVVKMLRGAVFFEFVYTYRPDGKLAQARITDADGRVSVLDYDQRGR